MKQSNCSLLLVDMTSRLGNIDRVHRVGNDRVAYRIPISVAGSLVSDAASVVLTPDSPGAILILKFYPTQLIVKWLLSDSRSVQKVVILAAERDKSSISFGAQGIFTFCPRSLIDLLKYHQCLLQFSIAYFPTNSSLSPRLSFPFLSFLLLRLITQIPQIHRQMCPTQPSQ